MAGEVPICYQQTRDDDVSDAKVGSLLQLPKVKPRKSRITYQHGSTAELHHRGHLYTQPHQPAMSLMTIPIMMPLRLVRPAWTRAFHQTTLRSAAEDGTSSSTASSSSSGSGSAAEELSSGEKLSGILLESLKKSEEAQAKSTSNNVGSGGEPNQSISAYSSKSQHHNLHSR